MPAIRIRFIASALAAAFILATPALADAPKVTVYKSPTCGCCSKWIEHLEENGFAVAATDVHDLRPIKQINGVPPAMASCHTALVGGYFVEGHVPAEDIRRLLSERPEIAGLAVPKMPEGSPGMEGPNPVPYAVWAIRSDGSREVYARHAP